MGQLADALRANLKAVAASDARALREIDQELKVATAQVASPAAALSGQIDQKALLGSGSFKQQTVATLKKLMGTPVAASSLFLSFAYVARAIP